MSIFISRPQTYCNAARLGSETCCSQLACFKIFTHFNNYQKIARQLRHWPWAVLVWAENGSKTIPALFCHCEPSSAHSKIAQGKCVTWSEQASSSPCKLGLLYKWCHIYEVGYAKAKSPLPPTWNVLCIYSLRKKPRHILDDRTLNLLSLETSNLFTIPRLLPAMNIQSREFCCLCPFI